MEARELLTRQPSAQDKRSMDIFLTEKGKEKALQVNEIGALIDEQALYGFSDEEKETLFNLLNRVLENMEVNHETKSR